MADISKINGYPLKDATARTDIANIKSGATSVGKATNADNANNATTANMALNCYDPSDVTKTYVIYSKFNELTQTIQGVENGVCKGYSFLSEDALIGALEAETTNAKYKIGDELYIKTADKPDYWVGEVLTTKGAAVTSIGDGTTVGFWVLYKLGEKTDLTEYQKKNDTSLNTTAKTVVEAINEVRTTANSAKTAATVLQDNLTHDMGFENTMPDAYTGGLGDGHFNAYLRTSLAKGALYAREALQATNDANGNAITDYIKNVTTKGPSGTNAKTLVFTKGDGTTLDEIDLSYTLPLATATVRGGVKVGAVRTSAVTTNTASSTANRYYAVERDSNEKLFVNVPWTDNNDNTQYTLNVAPDPSDAENLLIALMPA